MIKNYIKIAIRNILKRRVFSLINVVGLAVSLAVCLMIAAFVQNELTYDHFHSKGDRIYQMHYTYTAESGTQVVGKLPFPIKPVLLERFPEVEKVTRIFNNNASGSYPILQYGANQFSEDKFFFADPNIFEVFDFKLKKGNPKKALTNAESVIITEATAIKYFGNEDPIGKTIRYQNNTDLTVTGVLEPFPKSSHINFDFLAPVSLQRYLWMGGAGNNGYDLEQDWNWAGAWVYVLLKKNADASTFENKVQAIAKEFLNEPGENRYALGLEPLFRIHLYTKIDRGIDASGSIDQVYGFIGIAVLLLIIACINFMNLATAQSVQRAKEVGLRKVMGAHRGSLIRQFLGESLIIVFCATLLAGLLTEIFMPYFNQLTGRALSIHYIDNPIWIVSIVCGAFIIGIAAGSYPAFFLSRFEPAKTLKGSLDKEGNGFFSLRKLLVIVQFCLSTLLIIGILVIQEQLNFIRNAELGFDKEQIVVLKNGNQLNENYNSFRNELLKDTRVVGVSQGHVPGKFNWSQSFTIPGKESSVTMGIKHVDDHFVSLYNLKVVAGRAFTDSKSDSSEAVMINESAAKMLGWTNENAVGQKMSFVGGSDNRTLFNINVVGVLEDAHFSSFHREIAPIVFKLSTWGDVAIKLNLKEFNDYKEAIALVKSTWAAIMPDWPFEYSFLDDDINALYANEQNLSKTIGYAALVAILIACLGLFALVLFMVEQRAKEIGIRKVLGANELMILILINQYFIKIVLIASMISIPLGYILANNWLNNFAYHINLNLWIFILAAFSSLVIAVLTVSYHSAKAAMTNPVDVLKQN